MTKGAKAYRRKPVFASSEARASATRLGWWRCLSTSAINFSTTGGIGIASCGCSVRAARASTQQPQTRRLFDKTRPRDDAPNCIATALIGVRRLRPRVKRVLLSIRASK